MQGCEGDCEEVAMEVWSVFFRARDSFEIPAREKRKKQKQNQMDE